MSLLTRRAPHVVLVQRRVVERTGAGGRRMVNVGKRIRVRCGREPVRDWSSAEESQALGLQVLDLTVIRAKKWPGDIHSLIFWDGEMYETSGSPQPHSFGRRTSHWRVTVKWVGSDPTPDAAVEPDPEFDGPPDEEGATP